VKNLFELIPTSQSENISTATLAYMLANRDPKYQRLRDFLGFDQMIVDVITEHTFEDRRRIDLIVETQETVYGIEVKLGARFSACQLEDYESSLQQYASRSGKTHELIALVPGWLMREAKAISSQLGKHCRTLDWKQLTDQLNSNDEISRNLIDFVIPRLDELDSLDTVVSNNRKISGKQKQFLSKFLVHYFCDTVIAKNIGTGNRYTGCYIENQNGMSLAYLSLEILENGELGLVVLLRESIKLSADLERTFKDIKAQRNSSWIPHEERVLKANYRALKFTGSDYRFLGEQLERTLSAAEVFDA